MRKKWYWMLPAAVPLASSCVPSRLYHDVGEAGAPHSHSHSGEGGAGEGGHSGESSGATSGASEQGGASGAGEQSGSSAGDFGLSGGGGIPNLCEAVATPCVPQSTDSEHQSCGRCASGDSTRTRTCLANCTWSDWSAWSACTGETGECDASAVDSQSQSCGTCSTGTQTRTRTCSPATCTWGAWSGWGACGNVTAECEPDHWKCCGTGAWMWCSKSTCQWTGDCDAASCAASSYCTC